MPVCDLCGSPELLVFSRFVSLTDKRKMVVCQCMECGHRERTIVEGTANE